MNPESTTILHTLKRLVAVVRRCDEASHRAQPHGIQIVTDEEWCEALEDVEALIEELEVKAVERPL
jgi:hypothetical protein